MKKDSLWGCPFFGFQAAFLRFCGVGCHDVGEPPTLHFGFQAAFFPKNKLFILNKNLIFKKLIFLVEPTTEPTMFKPFIFSKNNRYYVRFYLPKQIRELIDRCYLFYNLFTPDESIARYNAAHIEQKVKEKMMIFEKMEKKWS